MGFNDSRPNYEHYNAISAAIAANPGVFGPGEADQLQAIMKTAIDNASDAKKKVAIVNTVVSVVKGGFTGGLPGAIAAIIGSLA